MFLKGLNQSSEVGNKAPQIPLRFISTVLLMIPEEILELKPAGKSGRKGRMDKE